MPEPNHRKIVALVNCLVLLLCASKAACERQGRVLSNPLGVSGHDACTSEGAVAGERRVGQCYNELECVASGGVAGGYCRAGPGSSILTRGVCCVHVSGVRGRSTAKLTYVHNAAWPGTGNGSALAQYTVAWRPDSCFLRIDLLTLQLAETDGNCVHDRLTVIGGKDMSGSLCGDRSGEVTIVEPNERRGDVKIVVVTQTEEWRYNLGLTQISCAEVAAAQAQYLKTYEPSCGHKNPSTRNEIGSVTKKKKKKFPDLAKILAKKSAKKVFKELDKLPVLPEYERRELSIYRPSFTRQKLDYRKTDIPSLGRSSLVKARILYGNETDYNEYPWQISMWIDKSHFCGGTLITDQWVVTAAHCVDLQYRRHFSRTTVSLGDHNVKVFNEATNTFRKIKRIVRFPTYDNNLIDGDLALLQLTDPVTLSDTVSPACLPPATSPTLASNETYAYSEAVITGWGYTEKTKILKPRPMTSDVLREAEVFILPQDLCVKYSPFPISDKMICTFKGPLGVETTCQGDSGGPLVVNTAENKWVVVGATSFGVATCEGPYPSMFARVGEFLPFINAAMVPSPFQLLDYSTPPVPVT